MEIGFRRFFSFSVFILLIFLVAGVNVSSVVGNMVISKKTQGNVRVLDNGREIEVTTDKDVYEKGEPVDIIITSVGELTIAGFPFLDIYSIKPDGYFDLVFWATPTDLPDLFELAPGESYVYTWDQKDKKGEPAEVGSFEVEFTFMACCGPIDTDYADFMIVDTAFNNPPDPPVINGPTSGSTGRMYVFNVTVTDQDDDILQSLKIDFGDGTTHVILSNWYSGDTIQVSYKWRKTGSYMIKAKVQDINGAWSDWGYHSMSIPKTFFRVFNLKTKTLQIFNLN